MTDTAAGSAGLSLITIKVVEVDAVQVVLRPTCTACVRLEVGRYLHLGPQDGVCATEVAKVFTAFCAVKVRINGY